MILNSIICEFLHNFYFIVDSETVYIRLIT